MKATAQLSNAKLSFLVALVLLALAGAFLYFMHPGGFFEGTAVWGFILLPGALVGWLVGDVADKISPLFGDIFMWSVLISFSLLWWAISYAVVRFFRRHQPWSGF